MIISTIQWILWYVIVQAASFLLTILGIIPVSLAILLQRTVLEVNTGKIHFRDRFMWIWDNEEDGIEGFLPFSKLDEFTWTEIRNPVANLRHVPGVSGMNRPLWWKTFTILGKQYYYKFGWMSDGLPACSFGSGRGY